MKRISLSNLLAGLLALAFSLPLVAQQAEIQYFRPWNKNGINVFEPSKNDDVQFGGQKLRIGGSFTQQYQSLTHENTAAVKLAADGKTNLNKLYPLGSGFNLATANLVLDFQIEDGIRICLENYMSSRHHSEFWVKGGYIQIDKLPMFGSPDWFTKYFRARIGHFQVNYGDQQFRRTDNGNAIYNPFIENYILDAFATEIGSEVYAFPTSNLMLMVGATSGLINGDVKAYAAPVKKNPSIYFKAAFDKQLNDNVRIRLSASSYMNAGTVRNTMYAGDRTGSHYWFALEPEYYVTGGVVTATSAANRQTSGRLDPGFTNEVTAFQINPFIKVKGLELFGTYEKSSGKANAESAKRDINQVGIEGLYRFFKNEQVYIGARYNKVSGDLNGLNDISIKRTEISAGWYPAKSLMLKGSIIDQKYEGFPSTDYRNGGKFNGVAIEAVVGF